MSTNLPNNSNTISSSDNNLYDVIIVGAGWSGLACAVTLAHHGLRICLLESAPHAGGRARKVQFKQFLNGQPVDNGQHIMLGAYHETLDLFKCLGINEQQILERQSLSLKMYSPEQANIQLKVPDTFAPLHLLLGFMQMQGVSLIERFKIIKMTLSLAVNNYQLETDISVHQLLKKHAQSQIVIASLWEPLCLATMNTPIQYASAQVFLRVLKDSFSRSRKDSELLFFRQDLSRTLVAPAIDFIHQHKGCFIPANKVTDIDITSNSQFLINTSAQYYQSRYLVLATPAAVTEKLLKKHKHYLKPDSATLAFNFEPICTIYMQYPPTTQLSTRMTGFFNTMAQWAIDRSLCNQPGLIAVVISGPGRHTNIPTSELAERIHHELKLCLTNLPDYVDFQVITEKKATFSCRVGIESQRPQNDTHIEGLYLAGDYTNTHYPATLEGAIKSGRTAAHKIITR